MIRLSSKVNVGEYTFNGLVDCNIESSWEDFTDTMTITFPRRINWDKDLRNYIKRAYPIDVYLGYNGYNKLAFTGYIKSVSSHVPIQVECEDAAYLFKQGNITLSYREATLREILKNIVPAAIDVASQPDKLGLGPFRVSNMTPAKVLDEIKQTYFQKFWFRNGDLYAGLAYWPELRKEHNFHFQKSIITHELEYLHEEDVKIKLTVIAVDSDNKKTEYVYGDPEGEQRTLYYYNKSKADIDSIAEQEIGRMKYTGYRGSFTTFGEPFMNHGDAVILKDRDYPERQGTYLVKSVKRNFGKGGYRQDLELDIKIE